MNPNPSPDPSPNPNPNPTPNPNPNPNQSRLATFLNEPREERVYLSSAVKTTVKMVRMGKLILTQPRPYPYP